MSFYCQKRKKKLGKKPHSQQSAFFVESKKLFSTVKSKKKDLDRKSVFLLVFRLHAATGSYISPKYYLFM